MELIRGLHNLRERHRGSVATIGAFDGVHRGHQAVLGDVLTRARMLGLPATVIVFEPLPREYFAPLQSPPRLMSFREKFAVLRDLAATDEATVVLAEQKLEWVAVFADRVIVLHEGRIVADGPPGDVLASGDLTQYGLQPTRYTQAARAALAAGLRRDSAELPVTLEEAVEYFK